MPLSGMMWISSAIRSPFGAGTEVMPTKSVGLIWSRRRGSTAEKLVVGAIAPVTVVPSVFLIVTDLVSMLAMVPRISIGIAGGASAANAEPVQIVKAAPSIKDRNVMVVSSLENIVWRQCTTVRAPAQG